MVSGAVIPAGLHAAMNSRVHGGGTGFRHTFRRRLHQTVGDFRHAHLVIRLCF